MLVRKDGELTDDEVDLRTKLELKVFVAHELGHLDGLDNSKLSCALRNGIM